MQKSTKRLVLAAGFLGLLISVVQIALAQPSNPLIGTWKMNVAKSKANPGPLNKSGTVKIEPTGAGAKYSVDNVSADGTRRHWEFTTNYDGKDSAVTGNSPYGETIAVTRIDAHTTRNINKKSGKTTVIQTTVASSDGKTRTVATKGTDTRGQPIDNVTVYDKQ
ncbi:MAG TPA: hypothetical protein VGZ27_09220 [Vicinamibacterales bacterium]|jgi:hypothetical protein|nr:hypothetical protein [Vicinamibacterales bacterium]